MRFAYYPGCTAKGSTREADIATKWLAQRTGIELVELVDAGCCGSCEIKAVNPTLHFMLNARILTMAADRDLEILTICDTCQANLLHTSRRMQEESDAKRSLLERLKSAGVAYHATPRVRHLASIVMDELGESELSRRVVRPLAGLRVAPFACCHSFRGPGASTGSRENLAALVALTGATVVPVRVDSDCCGFHILMTNEALAARTSAKFLARCAEMQADCIVTTSPLCHTALDIFQKKAEGVAGRRFGLPVLHLEQLLALAFGAHPDVIGLGRHMVSTVPVVRHPTMAARSTDPGLVSYGEPR